MMTKPISAGFIVRSAGKYLICHATQKKHFVMDYTHWTISKGMVEDAETPLIAAIRELKEETGIDLRNDIDVDGLDSLVPYKILNLKYKTIYAFFIDDPTGKLQKKQLHCDSLIDNEAHMLYGYPEMDNYRWVNSSVARYMVFNTHKELFDDLY